jgi:hypothetical protein
MDLQHFAFTGPSTDRNDPWTTYPVNDAAGPSTLAGGLTASAVAHFNTIATVANGVIFWLLTLSRNSGDNTYVMRRIDH